MQLFGRRALLYVAVTFGAIVAEALVVFLWAPAQSIVLAVSVIMPLQSAAIFAFVAADSRAEPVTAARTWSRALERVWAVVVIDYLGSAILTWGLGGTAQDGASSGIRAVFSIFVGIALIFADAASVVEDEDGSESALVRVALLVPRSIMRSVELVLLGGFVIRALVLFGFWIGAQLVGAGLGIALLHGHVPHVDFWVFCAIPTLANAPMAAATMVFYVDAGDFESSLGSDAEDEAGVK